MKNTIENKLLLEISKQELTEAEKNTWEYIFLFLSKYYDLIDVDPTVEDGFGVNDTYDVLVAYNVLFAEVSNGGFLGLIRNGYADYIFTDHFNNLLRYWGAERIALNLQTAGDIYKKNKIKLEELMEEKDVLQLYNEFYDFNALDKEFFNIVNGETEKIRFYIEKNISEFAIVA